MYKYNHFVSLKFSFPGLLDFPGVLRYYCALVLFFRGIPWFNVRLPTRRINFSNNIRGEFPGKAKVNDHLMSERNKALGLRPQRNAPTFLYHFGHREKMLPIKSVHDIARVVVDVSSQRSFLF